MYFIVEGEVELDFIEQDEQLDVASGDYFGEMALLQDTKRKADITARTDCQLLLLEASDFHRLMVTNPDIRDRITEITRARGYGKKSKTVADATAHELSQA
ncbi:cyclic nucleotide-binding domain-containing protein [Pseudomonadota bacterium]